MCFAVSGLCLLAGSGRGSMRLPDWLGRGDGRGWPRVSPGTAPATSSSGPTSSRTAVEPHRSVFAGPCTRSCARLNAPPPRRRLPARLALASCQAVHLAPRSLLRGADRRAGDAAHEGPAAAAPGPAPTPAPGLAWGGAQRCSAACCRELRPADVAAPSACAHCAVRVGLGQAQQLVGWPGKL